jgi:hypothetical protein
MRSLMPSAVAAAFALLGLVLPGLAADETCPAGEPDCCGKKVCCPTTKTWTRTRTEFGMVHEEFCPTPCCWFGKLFGGKGCCGEPSCCGKVRTRKVLVIKVRKEEHCLPDCVPVCAAAEVPCVVAPGRAPCAQAPAVSKPASTVLHLTDSILAPAQGPIGR